MKFDEALEAAVLGGGGTSEQRISPSTWTPAAMSYVKGGDFKTAGVLQ